MKQPDYMDEESRTALPNEALQRAANRLIYVFQHEQHNPPGEEMKALERMLAKLKQARMIASELSAANRVRVFDDPAEPSGLLDLIARTEQAIARPLPSKAKLENLYHTMAFDYQRIMNTAPTPSRTDDPNLFQRFMAVIVCGIEGRPLKDWEDYISRTTQHYRRVVQNPKK